MARGNARAKLTAVTGSKSVKPPGDQTRTAETHGMSLDYNGQNTLYRAGIVASVLCALRAWGEGCPGRSDCSAGFFHGPAAGGVGVMGVTAVSLRAFAVCVCDPLCRHPRVGAPADARCLRMLYCACEKTRAL